MSIVRSVRRCYSNLSNTTKSAIGLTNYTKGKTYQCVNERNPGFRAFNSVHSNINIRKLHTSNPYCKLVSFNLSDIGEGIREVVVKEWFVKEGDLVAQFDNICEVQSDKASVTITSRYDGTIVKLYHKIDEIALVGKPLIDIETGEAATTQDDSDSSSDEEIARKQTAVSKKQLETSGAQNVFAIPSVRRLAKENKIRLSDIRGSGKDGRILKEDVINYMNAQKHSAPQKPQDVKSEPIRGYTRTMIRTMTEAMKIPHFLYCDEIGVTSLVELRQKINKETDKVKMSYMPFFIKALSNALARYPVINARLDNNCRNILYNNNHNIGIAMDTPNGLAVPVIKNVQNMDVLEISRDLNRLQSLGKEDKFTPDDLSNGTFTVSNIGSIGGTYAKPIILPNQSAIIALGSFKKVPRFGEDGSVVPAVIMNISASADHRLIDGATMANFCNVLKRQIEEPGLLFLNV